MEKLTDRELDEAIADYQREVEFWAVDLSSEDDDVVAEARRFIWIATRRLNEAKAEKERRKEVKE